MKRLWLGVAALALLGVPTIAQQQRTVPPSPPASAIAIRAGRLVDPDAGTATANQIILVQDGKISAVGGNVPIPAGAQVIDLSAQTVLPGLVEAHNHGRPKKTAGRDRLATREWIRKRVRGVIRIRSIVHKSLQRY